MTTDSRKNKKAEETGEKEGKLTKPKLVQAILVLLFLITLARVIIALFILLIKGGHIHYFGQFIKALMICMMVGFITMIICFFISNDENENEDTQE